MSNDALFAPKTTGEKTSKDRLEPAQGQISRIIGSGENAQNSIVYKAIAWSFLSGGLFSSIVFGYIAYSGGGNPVDAIKGVWSIFVPVITLSLGYIFGKTK